MFSLQCLREPVTWAKCTVRSWRHYSTGIYNPTELNSSIFSLKLHFPLSYYLALRRRSDIFISHSDLAKKTFTHSQPRQAVANFRSKKESNKLKIYMFFLQFFTFTWALACAEDLECKISTKLRTLTTMRTFAIPFNPAHNIHIFLRKKIRTFNKFPNVFHRHTLATSSDSVIGKFYVLFFPSLSPFHNRRNICCCCCWLLLPKRHTHLMCLWVA